MTNKVKVIDNFLNDWQEQTRKWYIENAKLYLQLKENYNEALKEAKTKDDYYFKGYSNYDCEQNFKSKYYSKISSTTKLFTYCNKIHYDELDKMLEDEKNRKYNSLIKRITKVVGNIVDTTNLTIGIDGEINGLVKGDKSSASIYSISAGGYNIQCFHFRVLVHEVK